MSTKPTELRRCVLAGLLGLGLCAPAGPLAAQDLKPLLDRIDRLERDVNMLQRQVYRGTSPGGAPMAVSPPDAQGALGSEVRIGQLEDQMRTLTGQLEEINYAIDQMKRRLETLSSDVDQRFAGLNRGAPPAAAGTGKPAPAAAAPTSAAPAPPAATASVAAVPEASPRPGILGTLREPRDTDVPPQQQAAAPAAVPPPPPSGTPQEQYNYAFGLLRRADYPGAEQALKAFIQRFPADTLAGNAQYWLGETYYVRKDYASAATAFAVGYQKYPKSGKAADDLLKLGMSLGSLGKKVEACSAYSRLDRDFPTAPAQIKEREASERQQLGC